MFLKLTFISKHKKLVTNQFPQSKVFVADKLSDTNKKQFNSLKVGWVKLRSDGGFKRFETVLDHLKIPHEKLPENIDEKLEIVFKEIFK